MKFLNDNPELYPLLFEISSFKGEIRTSLKAESIKSLINLKYGLKENFHSIVDEFLDDKIKELQDKNIVKIYRLYLDNQPGPVFLDNKRAMGFIGLKDGSSINDQRIRIEPILVTREQSRELFELSVNLLSSYKKLVDEYREENYTNRRKRIKKQEKEILDFLESPVVCHAKSS